MRDNSRRDTYVAADAFAIQNFGHPAFTTNCFYQISLFQLHFFHPNFDGFYRVGRIYGGSSEVQRSVIAKRLLGL